VLTIVSNVRPTDLDTGKSKLKPKSTLISPMNSSAGSWS